MTTISDVANMAGVSTATVSHVINKTRFVGDNTKARGLAAMKDLNYSPSGVAHSLRLRKTKTIGLMIPDNANPFFAELSRVIVKVGYDNGYSVIFAIQTTM